MTATETAAQASPDGQPPPPGETTSSGATAVEDVPLAAAPPEPPTDDDGLDATEALPRLVKVAGEVVAPATLLTALLFQFGRLHSAGYFRHFGVNFTVLDLSTTDFLIVGADGLFVPLAGACVLALLLVWLHRFVLSRLSTGERHRVLHSLAPVAGLVGAVLLVLALLDLLTGVRLFWGDSEAGGISLAIGVLLVVYALRLVRITRNTPRRSASSELAEWGAAFLLVSVGLYWAVGSYAFGVGIGRAEQLQRALPFQPAAVLYSERSMSFDVTGVTEVRCADPEAAYRFRYDGLRLIRQAGNQYLLVAADWTRATGTAVLIPRGAGIRLEFRTALTPPSGC
ncbi:hypothetical protein [Blastococcus sp. CT_GayMR16]|uniref:hypothetical protein n=1 Tax=Blastococcus sp. CT_GayMR16 TaxID=2559607 RepID=UPI00107373AB|nr:hypothetical protein [Blastococcus sp. CT_GayMR16]TFV86290.1 hypothetical protein E4P38_17455 [Blastococcus sp. CT_GayMR16]